MSTLSTYEGVVVNGQIRLNNCIGLPERSQVYVVVLAEDTDPPLRIASPRLVDRNEVSEFTKEVLRLDDNA